jgi:hypothetical protein
MDDRTLVKLGDRYPGTSRMTRWRWKHDPDFPAPVILNGTEYYVASELTEYEEARRRTRQHATAAAETAT